MKKTVFGDDIQYTLPRRCGEDFFHTYTKTKMYEGELMLQMSEGSAFLDVGAHNGDVVLTLALYAKTHGREDLRFFAFEPDSNKTDFIKQTARDNNLDVNVYTCAVGDKSQLVSRKTDYPAGAGAVAYNVSNDNNISMICLDTLKDVFGEVGFLHLDVEGWEAATLTGSNHILSHNKPFIVAEVWNPISAAKRGFSTTPVDDIKEVLSKHGTRFKYHDTISDGNTNLVFVPEEWQRK